MKELKRYNLNRPLNHQSGSSRLGMLAVFLLMAGLLTTGFKIVPIYMDNNVLVGIINRVIDNDK